MQQSMTSIRSRWRLQPRHDEAIIFVKLVRLLNGTIFALVKLCQLGAQSAFHHPSSPASTKLPKILRVNRQLSVRTPALSSTVCGPRLSCCPGITARGQPDHVHLCGEGMQKWL